MEPVRYASSAARSHGEEPRDGAEDPRKPDDLVQLSVSPQLDAELAWVDPLSFQTRIQRDSDLRRCSWWLRGLLDKRPWRDIPGNGRLGRRRQCGPRL